MNNDQKLKKFNQQCQFTLKNIQQNLSKILLSKRSLISEMKINIISEMNENIFPIPKKLLSFFVKQIFESGFFYVSEYSMRKIIDDVYESENFDILKIDLKKLNSVKNKNFLMICLPYKLNIWKKQLKDYFTLEIIEKTFKDFNNENGSYGSSSNTYVIIINSDFLQSLKDIEKVVEHEFVHMFEDINEKEKNQISLNLLKILSSPDEYHTYVINLMNRLDKIFDRYCVINQKDDNFKNRRIFLDKIFKLAYNSASSILFYLKMKYYDDSKLLESNMVFLWAMIHNQVDQFEDFKTKIYEHFLKGFKKNE